MLFRRTKKRESSTVVGKGFSFKSPEKEVIISFPDSFRKGHFWCFGTTRVGKTRIMENMAEQDIRKGYNLVIIDPKGDNALFTKIVQVAMETKRMDDLILVTPVYPKYSAIIDPLAYYFMPEELVGHIVSGVEVSGDAKFFYNIAYEISLIIVQAFLIMARHENRKPSFNLNDVKSKIDRAGLEGLKAEIDSISDDEEARQLSKEMDQIIQSPQDYYAKVTSSLRTALTELTSGNIGKIVGKADENRFIKRLEKRQGVIMVVQLGALLTRQAAYTVGKVILSMIQSFVGRVFHSKGSVSPSLCVYIDEAQNVLYYGIEELFAKAGGAGVWMHAFCQSKSQIDAVLGKEYGNSILDNCNTKMYLRVPDVDTAAYVADHFGEQKVMSPMISLGDVISAREMPEEVIQPHDVLNLAQRMFLLTSYHGAYFGKSLDVSPLIIRPVKLPEIAIEE
jgi:conjugal transfer pilus assembly protein TraD